MTSSSARSNRRPWRRTFSRGGLKLVAAVVLMVLSLLAIGDAVLEWSDARGMTTAPLCPAGLTSAEARGRDCLVPVVGRIDGPRQQSRSLDLEWRFESTAADPAEATVSVSRRVSGRLERLSSRPILGLLWHSELVAFSPTTDLVRTPSSSDGPLVDTVEVIPTEGWGALSGLMMLLVACFLLGGALFTGAAGRQQARRNGGWWVAGEPLSIATSKPGVRLGSVAAVLVVPSVLAIALLQIGVPTTTALVASVVVPGLFAAAIVLRIRLTPVEQSEYRGRHARPPE